MDLINLLNPVYVLSNLLREIGSALSACDFFQPQSWLVIAMAICVVEAIGPLLEWAAKKILAMREQ